MKSSVGEPFKLRERRRYFQVYAVGLALAWTLTLVILLANQNWIVGASLGTIAAWTATLALASLPAVGKPTPAYLAPDTPITVAAGILLPPLACAIVALAGTWDIREIRRTARWEQAMFNRAQLSIAAGAQSWILHAMIAPRPHSILIFLVALVALVVGLIVNYVLVAIALHLYYGLSLLDGMARLRIGTPFDYAITLATWGIFGAMFAALYDLVSIPALPFFLLPILLGRQALVQSQRSADAELAYRQRLAAVEEISRHVQDERADERRLIAADLHDEALQSLYYVDVVANIVKCDLADGRLFELERDIRELVAATRQAADVLRSQIGDLRSSRLSRGGLGQALAHLIERSRTVTGAHLSATLGDLAATPATELVTYQIAKEALMNAIAHSGATRIALTAEQDDARLHLTVQDNGRGFDSSSIHEQHYGLSIMRERASASGAQLYIDSRPGHGTKVTFHAPRSASSTIAETDSSA